jgi:hypothetical protein
MKMVVNERQIMKRILKAMALGDWCDFVMTTTTTRLASAYRWDCRICSITRRWLFLWKSRLPFKGKLPVASAFVIGFD